MLGFNGGLIGATRFTETGIGVWTPNEQVVAQRDNSWAFDPIASAYIQAVEAADGQALELGVKAAINTFVISCKADNIWSAIKSSCILVGARTLSGALVPLSGTAPTNNNFVSQDYNRETGLLGNGSTKWLNSNRNSNADPQNSHHLAVYAQTAHTSAASGTNNFPVYLGTGGSSTGACSIGRLSSNSTSAYIRSRSSAFATVTSAGDDTGFICLNRSSSSEVTLRSNGSTSSPIALASETPFDGTIGVYRMGVNETTISYSNARISFYSIGESLNSALLDSRVTTLINDIAAAIP